MKNKKILLGLISLMIAFVLAACGGNEEAAPNENEGTESDSHENMDVGEDESSDSHSGHEGMNHSGSSEVPEGLAEAENPTYPVGSQAIIHANHMPGMDGAKATISGAFDTTAYTVTYTPTTGGEPVEDHKWVIHEEIKNAGDEPFQPGDEVVLNAEHMEGMDGVKAVIDFAEQTTVYMVDYTDTETGEKVMYHKWVTESELSPVE